MAIHYAPGKYWGTITNHGLGKSPTKGTPKFYIKFQVLGKVNPADPEQYEPEIYSYERTVDRYITDGTMEFLLEDLERLNYRGGNFQELEADGPGGFDLRGQQMQFYCQHEAGKDKDGNAAQYEKWGLARDGTGRQETKPEEDAIRKLNALYGVALKRLKRKVPPKAPADHPPAADTPPVDLKAETEKAIAEAGDDSIPF